MSLTDFLIALATVVFVMSTISERISNFLKLYFQDKIIYIPVISRNENGKWVFLLKARLRILAEKQITEAAEKEREYRILVINIIVGILSAAFININIFELFAVKDLKSFQLHLGWTTSTLGSCEIILGAFYLFLFLWSTSIILFSKLQETTRKNRQPYTYIPFFCWLLFTVVLIIDTLWQKSTNEGAGKILLHFAGYITMGLFLSLGSKFWHDLLDILFSFKRTQEKLSDPKLLTDFSSADQIIKYTEISQYNIAEQLYEKYRPKLWGIEGVVSCGLVTYFDERVCLYQKRIEVEFTTNEAQDRLFKIQAEGEVQINYNTFLLKDYLYVEYTNELVALPAVGIDVQPKCFAQNIKNNDIKGSFNIRKTNDGYVAFGCLHVFASENDFTNILQSTGAPALSDLDVKFQINGTSFNGKIIPRSIKFGNEEDSFGADYCECSVEKFVYDEYSNFIQQFNLADFADNQMKLFGATSKNILLKEVKGDVIPCRVKYGNGVIKLLKLYKVNPLSINVSPGDSGATVYYKNDSHSRMCMGIVVAKSHSHAYIFKLSNIHFMDSCKDL